jgi:hypothetical protein
MAELKSKNGARYLEIEASRSLHNRNTIYHTRHRPSARRYGNVMQFVSHGVEKDHV